MTAKQVPDLHLSTAESTSDYFLDLEIFNRAPGTIENYRSTLTDLAAYAGRQGWPHLSEISKSHLRQYLVELKSRPRWFGQRDGTQRLLLRDPLPAEVLLQLVHGRRLYRRQPTGDIAHQKVPQRVSPRFQTWTSKSCFGSPTLTYSTRPHTDSGPSGTKRCYGC